MPSDVSVELASSTVAAAPSTQRLPVGVGLTLGAGLSLALWICIGLAVQALFA